MPVLSHSYAHFQPASGPAVVQAAACPTDSQAAIAFTLADAPAAGNVLAAFCSYSQSGTARWMNVPAGWRKLTSGISGSNSLAVFLRTVQAGDGVSHSLAVSGSSASYAGGVLYEIAGADAVRVVSQSGMASFAGTATASTAAVTPSADGCLALAGVSSSAGNTLSSPPDGWTATAAGGASARCWAARRDAAASGTSAVSASFGLGTSASGVTQIVLFLPPQGAPRFLAGIAGTGSGSYFTDQDGAPYMVRGDTCWGLAENAGASNDGTQTWQYDITVYLATRAAQGYNSVLVSVCDPEGSGDPNPGGATWDGVAPFSSWDASGPVLNETYWARVDYLVSAAEDYGITVFLSPCSYYAFSNPGGPLVSRTSAQMRGYGHAIGDRYAAAPNLAWQLSTDYHDGTYDTQLDGFLTGLRTDAGDTRPLSIENWPNYTSRWYPYTGGKQNFGYANAQYNWSYNRGAGYSLLESCMAETDPGVIPAVHGDGLYYGDTITEGARLYYRKLFWWNMTSGARGAFFGAGDLWNWGADRPGRYLSERDTDRSDLQVIFSRVEALDGWHQLVPDLSSQLVTAGRGTHLAPGANGREGGTNYQGGNAYVTASRTADGTLAVIYIPAAASITIDESKVGGAGNYAATWIDPVNGSLAAAAPGAVYDTAARGANSAGDPDWVLALTAAA